jgi:hypothetical protein
MRIILFIVLGILTSIGGTLWFHFLAKPNSDLDDKYELN